MLNLKISQSFRYFIQYTLLFALCAIKSFKKQRCQNKQAENFVSFLSEFPEFFKAFYIIRYKIFKRNSDIDAPFILNLFRLSKNASSKLKSLRFHIFFFVTLD